MNRWILELREYNYEIQYLKGKDNFVADHLSRPLRIIVRPPEASWFGLDKQKFMVQQREETVWGELVSYLQGGKIPSKRLPMAILDQFALVEEMLYFVREKTDVSLHYSLIVPRRLTVQATQHAHELSGQLGQKENHLKGRGNVLLGQSQGRCM